MPIRDFLLPEYEHEMTLTRKALERVPLERAEWKPHEKSMALGYLASHLADMPQWMVSTIEQDELDLADEDGKPYSVATQKTRDALLATFDGHVAAGREALSTLEDADLGKMWSLKMGGQTVLRQPKIVILRSLVMNHIIHHRGQLSVYLRLLGVPVPALYGPSADERE